MEPVKVTFKCQLCNQDSDDGFTGITGYCNRYKANRRKVSIDIQNELSDQSIELDWVCSSCRARLMAKLVAEFDSIRKGEEG